MHHRSFKRVLGETNLERKCRVAFVVCLACLLGVAFWGVDRISESLIRRTTQRIGHERVTVGLIKVHWQYWETREDHKRLLAQLVKELGTDEYAWSVLRLEDETPWGNLDLAKLPQDEEERQILEELEVRWRERMRDETADHVLIPDLLFNPADGELVFTDRRPATTGQYTFYQPMYWRGSCVDCHTNGTAGVLDAAQQAALAEQPPFRVVKVSMSYDDTRRAINRTRAILAAGAILTVFGAMLALYVVVRYVIVKPLKHLRDVSDEIGGGKLDVRAEINTNDEFQELGESFNRMVRHLTDAQRQLRQVNSALDTKVDELAQLNMRLYEMNRLKDDFLANMSHELRTPLNSIIGFSEVLQDFDSLNPKQKRYAQNIQKSGRLLLEMINDILDLAKMEAGKMEVKPTEFRIDNILHAQCDMVRSLTDEKNIDLVVQVENTHPSLFQDQAKVQQILTNLLSNAIKFTPQGGRIRVSAFRDLEDRVHLIVEDTGVGIAKEDRETIFEKFRQSSAVMGTDGLTREFAGTGLGLSIIKELCKLLGGEIRFESEVGKGSTFEVVLPWTCPMPTPNNEGEMSTKLDPLTRPPRDVLPNDSLGREPAASAGG